MAALAQLLQFILRKIVAAVAWIGELVVACFVALWDLGRDLMSWCFEQVMDLVIAALESIDLSAVTNVASGAYGEIPAAALEAIAASGAGPAVAVIGAALVVRIVLQLIPFTRLGS